MKTTPTVKTLFNAWQSFKKENTRKLMKSLTFHYGDGLDYLQKVKTYFRVTLLKPHLFSLYKRFSAISPDSKKQAISEARMTLKNSESQIWKLNEVFPALVFWKFLRSNDDYQNLSFDEKRNFLSSFISNEHRFIVLVAMIESFPSELWRKILWNENIDFMSTESFLRRLTIDQEAEIMLNYTDFMESPDKIPQAFQKTFGDKIRVRQGKIIPASIREGDYDLDNRYQSRGAWAYNLLGLDFGFSLYPKGENNDTKITNEKFTRFISIKNHINDFIVNQENGLYWWLYQKARSNYVIRPNKGITLKTHICPGFWVTLILHTIFWIVSPILFVSSVILLLQGHSSVGTVGIVVSSITPLWLLCAGIKFLWIKLGPVFGRYQKNIQKGA